MKSITRITTITLIATLIVTVFSFTAQNHAAALFTGATNQACSGVNLQPGATTCTGASSSITSLVRSVIFVISWIVGIASIFMIIFGSFRFITSGGDSNATASARNTVIYALIGLAIAAIAQLLIYFVLDQVNKSVTPPVKTAKKCIQWDTHTAGLCDKYGLLVTSQPIVATTVSPK